MCGTLKFEGIAKVIGNIRKEDKPKIPFFKDGVMYHSQWLGFQQDTSPFPKESVRVIIPASSYTEVHKGDKGNKNIRFIIPQGKGIDAIFVRHKNFPNKHGLFIITREATKEERTVCNHNRRPRLIPEGLSQAVPGVQQELNLGEKK
jgi:hypothetical protein